MPRVDVWFRAPYTWDTSTGVTQTGSGDVLADGSDATYVTLPGYGGDVFLRFVNSVGPTRTPGDFPVIPMNAEVSIRFKYDGPAQQGRWNQYGGNFYIGDLAIPEGRPGWGKSVIHSTDPIAALNGAYGFEMRVENPSTTTVAHIYEACLTFEWSSEAPPCRIFPREDGLGVGAGRNYPPNKSQQRSSRGVGYY